MKIMGRCKDGFELYTAMREAGMMKAIGFEQFNMCMTALEQSGCIVKQDGGGYVVNLDKSKLVFEIFEKMGENND